MTLSSASLLSLYTADSWQVTSEQSRVSVSRFVQKPKFKRTRNAFRGPAFEAQGPHHPQELMHSDTKCQNMQASARTASTLLTLVGLLQKFIRMFSCHSQCVGCASSTRDLGYDFAPIIQRTRCSASHLESQKRLKWDLNPQPLHPWSSAIHHRAIIIPSLSRYYISTEPLLYFHWAVILSPLCCDYITTEPLLYHHWAIIISPLSHYHITTELWLYHHRAVITSPVSHYYITTEPWLYLNWAVIISPLSRYYITTEPYHNWAVIISPLSHYYITMEPLLYLHWAVII